MICKTIDEGDYMRCPNCKKKFTSGNKCPHCNVDAVLYLGTVRLSDRLYNQGLDRLRASDFYHGIDALTKSISINKNNVPARNLLGLALFEVGHVGDALKHWVISQSQVKENNPASSYIEMANENPRALERLNDAVLMFNQALGQIKQKSDDLATIQLKKAVDINPNFIDALNLLTLCYLIQSDRDHANAAAERVLAIDIHNPVALNYYSILNPNKPKPTQSRQTPQNQQQKRPQPPPPTKNPYESISVVEKKRSNFHILEILMFVIGVVGALAVVYFLIIPQIERDHDVQIEQMHQQMMENETFHRSRWSEALETQDALNDEIFRLETEMDSLEDGFDRLNRERGVLRAFILHQDDQLIEAMDILDGIDISGLPFDIVTIYEELLEDLYPRVGVIHYNEGLEAFNENDYYFAITSLETALRFLDYEAAQWNQLLFMLGSLYYQEGRMDEAHFILSELAEHAPNHQRTQVTNMLTSIEEQM